jgi:hypothetical protein
MLARSVQRPVLAGMTTTETSPPCVEFENHVDADVRAAVPEVRLAAE